MSTESAATIREVSAGPPTLSFEGKTFRFKRNTTDDKRGEWFCDQRMGQMPPHSVVPLEFGKDLTTLARARGVTEEFDYALHPPRVEKKPPVKAAKEPRPYVSGGMLKVGKSGAHNPLAVKTLPVSEAPPKKHFPMLKLNS